MKQQLGPVNVPNFIDKSEQETNYSCLNNALDRILWMLRQNGIGVERKRAAVITQDIESKHWETGVIGCYSPQALLNAVFCLQWEEFCLRGISEHFKQITRLPSKYTYVEFGSKNHSGGVSDRSEGKTVSIVSTSSEYCHVSILDENIPRDEIIPDTKFHLCHSHHWGQGHGILLIRSLKQERKSQYAN